MMVITPGDVLSRRKGIFTHKGIFLGKGRVFHILPGQRAHVCSWEEFAAGKTVKVKTLRDVERVQVLESITAELESERRYHPLRNNCQHVVNRVRRGVSFSEEMLVGAGALLFASATALLLSKARR